MTVVGSADGTPPFFGRLRAAYRDPRAPVRGRRRRTRPRARLSSPISRPTTAGRAFSPMAAIGALCLRRRRPRLRRLRESRAGERTQAAELAPLCARRGARRAGRRRARLVFRHRPAPGGDRQVLGLRRRQLSPRPGGSSAISPPIRSSTNTAQVNLGEVAGGVRLFWSELVAGVINWSLAAPLFSINYVLLDAVLQRSLRPIKNLLSPKGVEGLVEQGVRVLRWGLWMAPIINSFLRQSPDPSWYNQDGAIRTGVVIGADATQTPEAFRRFSLVLFLGLLAYDWLRILIWFDHMGLRVASLVNLSFLGGDRADEAAARFVGHNGRTRAIPDGIRRFMTWAPLLIPFYIPRGAEWDFAWTGAEKLARDGGPMPEPVRTLAFAYGGVDRALRRGRGRDRRPAARQDGRARAVARRRAARARPQSAILRVQQRRGRGRAFPRRPRRGLRHGRRARRRRHRPHSPAARSAAGARPFLLCDGRGRRALVDRLRARAPRRRVPDRGAGLPSPRHRPRAERDRGADGDRARRRAGGGAELEDPADRPIGAGRGGCGSPASARSPATRRRPTRATSISPACMSRRSSSGRSTPSSPAIGSCARRAPTAARRRSSRSSPGAGAELVGYEDSRTRFLGEGSLASPTGCEPWRWRKLDDEGKLWTFDPAASFTVEMTLRRERRGRGRVRHGPLRQRRLGERADRAPARPAAAARARPANAHLRNPRGRAVARAARAAGRSPVGRRQAARRSPIARRVPGRM